jgi:hypothetical protein
VWEKLNLDPRSVPLAGAELRIGEALESGRVDTLDRGIVVPRRKKVLLALISYIGRLSSGSAE